MNTVQPIRDSELIQGIRDYLYDKSERNYILFELGIQTGLRISDILRLRVRDVESHTHILIREKKTSKERRIIMNKKLRKALNNYIQGKAPEEYIIKSRVGKNQPIGRSMAYKVLRDAANQFNLREIGTHTMRKTWGYMAYKRTKDISTIQKVFNHRSPEDTLRYIGITQDTIDDLMMKVDI